MRIRYLVPAPGVPVQGPSGASAHVRGLVSGWRSLGHTVDVLAAREVDRRGAFGQPVGAVALGVPGWPSWLERYRDLTEVIAARRLSRHLIEAALGGAALDVVVERHSLFSDAGWRVHDRLGVPWVLEVNAPLAQERARFEALRRPAAAASWEREVLQAAPAIAAVSAWLARWLREEVGCKGLIRHVPNGVTPFVGDRARGRAALGVPEGAPLVGFVGSMKAWHGLDRLARVAAALGARLALIGAGGAVEGAVATGHLEGQALADAVAALDLGLAPYPADAPPWFCPLKVLDYRAQGTPVLGTDVGDVAALVGEAGAVVPPGDDDALIAAGQAWIGRRTTPSVRSWATVGAEVLGLASTQPPPR